MTRLMPPLGFCAETGDAITLFAATSLGDPVSTTHTITGAMIGVGVARSIVTAWIITMPMAGLITSEAYLLSGFFLVGK